MLGYKYKNYDINNNNEELVNMIRDKIDVVKKIIYRFQRLIYRLINNYYIKKKLNEYEKENEEENFFSNKYDQLIEKYGKKLKNINIVNKEGNHLILRHWKSLSDNLQYHYSSDIEINAATIDYEKLQKYDKEGTLLNFYFINEINKLYTYNENKQIKINITALIYDYINITFSLTNEEKTKSEKDYKRFEYILNSKVFIDEIKEQIGKTEGIYEEAIDEEKKEITEEEQNKIDNDNEENDALDIEGNEYDYEAGYERNLERDFDDGFVEKYEFTYLDYYNNTNKD
jgi:hypothetical protein